MEFNVLKENFKMYQEKLTDRISFKFQRREEWEKVLWTYLFYRNPIRKKEITLDSNLNSMEEMKNTRNNDNVDKYKSV
jgi:hypothetical protein